MLGAIARDDVNLLRDIILGKIHRLRQAPPEAPVAKPATAKAATSRTVNSG
jgi:hypothetical protein